MERAVPHDCCLAHGLFQLHLQTEGEKRTVPVALHDSMIGEQALRTAGPRVRRVSQWDAAAWTTWWDLLGRLASGRPAAVAIPPWPGSPEETAALPPSFPTAYQISPAVAVRAASDLPRGTALYLGAFAWESAPFGPEGLEEPISRPPGLLAVYREVITEVFRREGRPLLLVQIPALLREGFPLEGTDLVESLARLLENDPVLLGGEDEVVNTAVVAALRGRGHTVVRTDPLHGLQRLVRVAGGIP